VEFEHKVEWVARVVAEAAYRRKRPAATAEQARAWVGGNWTRYIHRALEVLAVREAWREARRAARWN
jgi:hypothetical protein